MGRKDSDAIPLIRERGRGRRASWFWARSLDALASRRPGLDWVYIGPSLRADACSARLLTRAPRRVPRLTKRARTRMRTTIRVAPRTVGLDAEDRVDYAISNLTRVDLGGTSSARCAFATLTTNSQAATPARLRTRTFVSRSERSARTTRAILTIRTPLVAARGFASFQKSSCTRTVVRL